MEMAMAQVDTEDLVSVTEIGSRGVSHFVTQAASGRDIVVLRNNKPAAMLISVERYEQMQQALDDAADLALGTARLALAEGAELTGLDDVLAEFGTTREELLAEDDT